MGGAVRLRANLEINQGAMKRARERLRGAVRNFPEHRGSVGVHEDESGAPKLDYNGKPTNTTLGEVAAYHEFHERSYLRTWFDTNKDRIGGEMKTAMQAQYEGNKNAVDDLMVKLATELRAWIEAREGALKPLSPATVAAKTKAGLSNPDVPLLATGQLVDSIRAHLDGYRL